MIAAARRPIHTAQRSSRTDDASLQLVTFIVNDREYAIPLLLVQEINRVVPVTRVPQTPSYIEGAVNLRGKNIPVINLRTRFGDEAVKPGKDSRLVVVAVAGRVIGLVVDRVSVVVQISGLPDEASQKTGDETRAQTQSETHCPKVDTNCIKGIATPIDQLYNLLDLDALFDENALSQLDRVARHDRTEHAAA